jgi:type II secretory pathway predicted ATPase ExeA
MYETFYGFKEKPFSMLPDPSFLFLSKKHQAALTLLEYGLLNHVGFCVITGEPGAGKTTIIRALLERVSENITVGLITNTHQSFGGLLDWVLSAFDLHRPNLTTVEMHQIFMEFLIEEYAKNRSVLLIVDEAQNMQPDTLEELRMLSNVNSEKDQLLQVVLSGQPELKEMLIRPELMQFAQRIAVDYHLETLNVEETCGYIQHRMITAGAERDVFTPAACERIHNYSGGTPRLINLLCETVLVYGFADQLQMIDVDLVDEMVQERMKNSVVPIVNRDVIRQDNSVASEKLEKNFPWIQPRGELKEPEPVSASMIEPEIEIDPVAEITDSTVKEAVPLEVSTASEKIQPVENVEVENIQVEDEVEPQQRENQEVLEDSAEELLKDTKADVDPLKVTGGAVIPPIKEDSDEARKRYVKYGAVAVVFALVLISAAVMFDSSDDGPFELAGKETADLQRQQDVEKARLEQLQFEAEAEADALIEKNNAISVAREEEKRAEQKRAEEEAEKLVEKQRAAEQLAEGVAVEQKAAEAAELRAAEQLAAEKLATEKAALAEKTAEKKRIRDEQKRIYRIKEKEREARYAVEREKRKAAKIAEEQRLKEQEEMRRLEREWLEKERQSLKSLETSQAIEVEVKTISAKAETEVKTEPQEVLLSEETVAEEGIRSPDCSGSTARFKANCR